MSLGEIGGPRSGHMNRTSSLPGSNHVGPIPRWLVNKCPPWQCLAKWSDLGPGITNLT